MKRMMLSTWLPFLVLLLPQVVEEIDAFSFQVQATPKRSQRQSPVESSLKAAAPTAIATVDLRTVSAAAAEQSTTTTTSTTTTSTSSSKTNTYTHTLLLCRHGDSIWNGNEPGCPEKFTGWNDVPLSQRGIQEAKTTADLISQYTASGGERRIDVCCTSVLQRAQMTAHYCLFGSLLGKKPPLYVTDYRLNERHYGALQGLNKQDVEDGKMDVYGKRYSPAVVQKWRRSWYEIPPLLRRNDPRHLKEKQKYQNYVSNIPRGESLDMVAKNRIQPFVEEKLIPLLNQASNENNSGQGGTALIVAHANSLRALIGVICHVNSNNNTNRLQKLEAMKIPTGVPIVVQLKVVQEEEITETTTTTTISIHDNKNNILNKEEEELQEEENILATTNIQYKYKYRAVPKNPMMMTTTTTTSSSSSSSLQYLSSSIIPSDHDDNDEGEDGQW